MPASVLPSGVRRRLPVLVSAGLLASLAAPVTGSAEAATPPGPKPPAVSAATAEVRAAQVEARETGERQEIASARTEYDTTYVNPSGTTTRVLSAVPVRVRRAGGWTGVDTTLVERPDGSLAPRAALLDVAFSGGGDQPLARVRREGTSVSLGSPWRLPEPELDGDTATYPEVLPGVDLAVKAEAEGFREVLVVKNREAAGQQALRELRFALRTDGVDVEETGDGGLAAVDRFGSELLTAARPAMWDSSSGTSVTHPETGADATSIVGPAEGDAVAPMDLDVSRTAVEITPGPDLLTSPGTTFPLYIDPSFGAGKTQWAMVNASYPGQSYYRWGNGSDNRGEGMGHVNTAEDGRHTKRLFYAFDTGRLNVTGRTVVSATFRAFQTWSYNCASAGVEAWLTNGFGSGTTWNNQPSWVGPHTARNAPKYGRPDCTPGGGWVDFDVKNQVIASVLKPWAITTIGLKAANEGSSTGWRRFKNNATLEVEYNTVPNVPTSPQMSSPTTRCGGVLPGSDPAIMQVRASDPDGTRNQVRVWFQIWKAGAPAKHWEGVTAWGRSGDPYSRQMPKLTDGTWSWIARTEDTGKLGSGWSSWCSFTVDSTIPAPPLIWFDGGDFSMGSALDFHFTGGGKDVVSYRWGVNTDAPTSPAISVFDGKAKVPLRAFGPFTLRVWAYDAAGHVSSAGSWGPYLVAGADALDWWRMDEGSGSSVVNQRTAANPLQIVGTVGWTPGRLAASGSALLLDGSGTAAAGRQAGALADGQHFSVAAWVKPVAGGGTGRRVVLSQDAGANAAFTLAMENVAGPPGQDGAATPVAPRMVGTLWKADGTAAVRVVGGEVVPAAEWTHAALMVEHQADGTLGLRLVTTTEDGLRVIENAAESTTGTVYATAAAGTVRVGAELRGSAVTNRWNGAIDDVVTARGLFDDEQLEIWRKLGG